MQLAQSSCTTQARKCIDRYRIPEHTAWIPRRPALPESRDGVSPWPPSLPPNSARANKSFHALHGDWAESVLGAERRMAAMQPGRGLGPVAQHTPAALKYGTCSTEISGGKRSRAGGECCHSGSSSCVSPRLTRTLGGLTSSRQRAQPTWSLGLLVSRLFTTGTSDQVLA